MKRKTHTYFVSALRLDYLRYCIVQDGKNASQIQFRAGSKDEPNVKGLSTCSGKCPRGVTCRT